MIHAHPFLKWAGGKRQLLPEIRKHVPQKFGRYFEPFVGAGAVFFDLFGRTHSASEVVVRLESPAVIGDSNVELMETYHAVQRDVEGLIGRLKAHAGKHSEDYYYKVRAQTGGHTGARMIYLNRTGFNGLYRVNKKGEFNVPFGRYVNPTICDEENLRACSRALHRVRLIPRDFETVVTDVERGDFVYFDCPYWPVSESANFTSYTKDGFGADDQQRLRDCALRLKSRGVHVLLSNANVPPVRRLYAKGFRLHKVLARRNINSSASRRGAVGELLIT